MWMIKLFSGDSSEGLCQARHQLLALKAVRDHVIDSTRGYPILVVRE